MLLVAVTACLATGFYAGWKGYSFVLWLFAGGAIGLLVLLALPRVGREQDLKARGDTIGAFLSIAAAVAGLAGLAGR